MKSYFKMSSSIEELVDALNEIRGDISVVEPDGKNYGYYLEFFKPGSTGAYFVFFGDQAVISSDSRDEIICFLWGLSYCYQTLKHLNSYNTS